MIIYIAPPLFRQSDYKALFSIYFSYIATCENHLKEDK